MRLWANNKALHKAQFGAKHVSVSIDLGFFKSF
jgi:hypothetical protein